MVGWGDDGSRHRSWQRQWLINLSSGGSRLTMGLDMGHFFFLGGLWGSVIRGGHGWWSLASETSLASLLAWG